MSRTLRNRRRYCTHARWSRFIRPCLEPLEARSLPANLAWPGLLHPVAEVEVNDTLDHAQGMASDLNFAGRAEVVGAIGNGPAGAADVDWYQFTLTRPATVRASTLTQEGGSSLHSVLSLYAPDPNDPTASAVGYRLLSQADGGSRDAQLERALAPGTYYLAVSGSGNRFFYPLLANSGYEGSTGPYGLAVTATDVTVDTSQGATVLAADPAPGTTLNSSPLVLRLDLSAALDGAQTFQLVDGAGQSVGFSPNFIPDTNQLQLMPSAPLPPGTYTITLTDDTGQTTFTDTFQASGVEGNTTSGAGADDTASTAHDIGDVTKAGIVQISAAIGDDPTDPMPFSPNDVDLYHFQVTGAGPFAFRAEAFGGRIGSPLQAGLSLFRFSADDGQLHLIAASPGSLNSTMATDLNRPGWSDQPLLSDPALFAGLTAGDYYLAVSSSGNVPDLLNNPPGTNGVFDPAVSHSGLYGSTTGPYVLNLEVQAEPGAPPHVVATTPAAGATLSAPPTHVTVHFDKPVNLQQVAFQAFLALRPSDQAGVFILEPDGTKVFPRLESYDPTTGTASFLMLDGLPNGVNELHFSGPQGLTDFGGNGIVSNDPSGDYVARFTVQGPERGTNGNVQVWTALPSNGDPAHPQDLGVLFPHELQGTGVQIVRDFSGSAVSVQDQAADYYRFGILQDRTYSFVLSGPNVPAGVHFTLREDTGKIIPLAPGIRLHTQISGLTPGVYVLEVSGWPAGQGGSVQYQVLISLFGGGDNPTPLTSGPVPALRIRLITTSDAPGGGTTNGPGSVVGIGNGASNTGTHTPGAPSFPIGPISTPSAPTGTSIDLARALASGPIGGVGGQDRILDPATPNRVLVRLPDSGVLDGLVQLTIVTQASGTDGNTSSGDGTTDPSFLTLITDSVGKVARAWSEALFHVGGAHHEAPVNPSGPHHAADPQDQDESSEDDAAWLGPLGLSGDTESAMDWAGLTPGRRAPAAPDDVWVRLLSALLFVPLTGIVSRDTRSPRNVLAARSR